MSYEFAAVDRPDEAVLARISRLTPHSPFNAPAYGAALHAASRHPCALTLSSNGELAAGCLAVVTGGRFNRRLEIFSATSIAAPDVFWQGTAAYCRDAGIRTLSVQSFASLGTSMPPLRGRLDSRDRYEFVMDLDNVGAMPGYSKNHKRSIRKAEKAGISVASSNEFDDYVAHVDLMLQSMVRRERRGENVVLPSQRDFDYALLEAGAGMLFKAMLDGTAVASILVLLSPTSGYYQSAGTSPEGMALGASPFLIHQVAGSLAAKGLTTFNLGGVDPGADGLRRFKSGFGTREIALRAETFAMTSMLRYRLTELAIAARDLGGRLLPRR